MSARVNHSPGQPRSGSIAGQIPPAAGGHGSLALQDEVRTWEGIEEQLELRALRLGEEAWCVPSQD